MSAVPGWDPERFRTLFPGLAGEGSPDGIVHLASCSQGALSRPVAGALEEFAASARDLGAPWDLWTRRVDLARERFAALIGARAEEVAVVPNASVGAYQVASTIDWTRRPGLTTTVLEFPSIAHVWLAQRPAGAEVGYDDFARSDRSTGLVSVPLVSYRDGARLPAADIARTARRAGARVFVDAYQAVGVLPVDVGELGCDYLVAGALKYLLGVPGIAFLYVRDGVEDECPPRLTGWFGRADPYAFDPRTLDFAPGARRYETGTPAIPAAYAAAAALELVGGLDLAAVEEHVSELVGELHERLAVAGERLMSPPAARVRGPMAALHDPDPERLGAWLAARGIVVAPRGRAVRLSLHYYNTLADVEAVCAAVAEYRARH
ncbi:aminotransferase class V-fold PLP-dependent enzyme [Actinomadura litoris]|uniref:aminotransferase class V-fold PLP-dependent enzyme n=1 Tax=Actinomadura litoris TaxID=2678616 RepID=UPI001FA70FCB|nr:aminotransferase class V-fold PLP-dependent enzyme [Actinomadura litoris]